MRMLLLLFAFISCYDLLLSMLTALACDSTWVNIFYCVFLNITKVMYLQCWHGWCHIKLLPSWHVLCTQYNHALCRLTQSHVHKVPACLAVTCHLHFWKNGRDRLRAAAVMCDELSCDGARLDKVSCLWRCCVWQYRVFVKALCVTG